MPSDHAVLRPEPFFSSGERALRDLPLQSISCHDFRWSFRSLALRIGVRDDLDGANAANTRPARSRGD
jgi:integrase